MHLESSRPLLSSSHSPSISLSLSLALNLGPFHLSLYTSSFLSLNLSFSLSFLYLSSARYYFKSESDDERALGVINLEDCELSQSLQKPLLRSFEIVHPIRKGYVLQAASDVSIYLSIYHTSSSLTLYIFVCACVHVCLFLTPSPFISSLSKKK